MALLYQYGIATNPDKFTYAEAAQVTDAEMNAMATASNSTVTSFAEFEYFTGMTVIPDNYLRYWSNLTFFKLPSTCTTIGNYFYTADTDTPRRTFNANKILEIPDSVQTIGSYCFICRFTGEIRFGKGLKTIGYWNFRLIDPSVLEFPDSLTYLGGQCFYQLTKITSITFGNNIKTIDNYSLSRGSSANTTLTSLRFPNSLETIGTLAFRCMARLSIIDFGTGIKTIRARAFEGVSNSYLTTLIVRATTPPNLSSTAFNSLTNCSLYVPRDSISLYEIATNWKSFLGRIYAIEDMNESEE